MIDELWRSSPALLIPSSCPPPRWLLLTIAPVLRKGSIKKLERAARLAVGCPECGWGDPHENVEIVVWWQDIDGEPPPEGFEDFPEETTYCGTCGRPDKIVITWGDVASTEEFDPHRSEKLRQERDVRPLQRPEDPF